MTKEVWNGTVIAESEDIALVEGNSYFPINSLKMEYFEKSDEAPQTHAFGKGLQLTMM